MASEMRGTPVRGSKAGRRILRAAVAAALLLAVSESALRLGFGFGRPLLYAADASAGYIAAPNQELRRFGARIHINEYGMRSASLHQPRPLMERRLLFIGDSVTFGTTYVDQERIFTTLIQEALNREHGRVTEVLNASAGGWAPENEYRYLSSRGTFDANAVIFVVNTNDLGQPFEHFKASLQFPVRNPLTATGEVLERYVAPRIISGIQTSDPGSMPTSEPDPAIEARVLQALSQANAFASRHGSIFMLVFSPTDAAEMKTPAWKKAIENLETWAHDSGVVLIDMSARYSQYKREQVYFDGIHLRPFGHQLVASEIVRELDKVSRLY
jgi:lysophospholipase L1-like esterase